jgi:hypothetical protein
VGEKIFGNKNGRKGLLEEEKIAHPFVQIFSFVIAGIWPPFVAGKYCFEFGGVSRISIWLINSRKVGLEVLEFGLEMSLCCRVVSNL